MKKKIILLLALCLTLGLCACAQKEAALTWQEQYDLGVRCLSEGNYEEAILAFTAAIEIEPKRAVLYIGRADAYIGSGETEENLASALADYEAAAALDETNAAAWLGIADIYIRQGEYEKAMDVLRQALEKTGNDAAIADKLAEMESGSIVDSSNHIRRRSIYEPDGTLNCYTLYEYDEKGRRCGWKNWSCIYWDNGNALPLDTPVLESYCVVSFNSRDLPERNQFYEADGTLSWHDTFVYNEAGLKTEQHRYAADGEMNWYYLYYYNERGLKIRCEGYRADGTMFRYWISEYDADGNFIRETGYNPDGSVQEYSVYD